MRSLAFVTFTGWDRHTDLAELAKFLESQAQDTVEIAVLHSASRIDEDRYPDTATALEILRTAKASGQMAAVHLCGNIARMFLSYSDALLAAGPLIQLADRVQVNVGEDFWPRGTERYRPAANLSRILKRPVIVQSRDADGWPDVEDIGPGAGRMVPFLFDRSGGRGVAEERLPEPPKGRLVGYAGGLGPDNAASVVGGLAGLNRRFWIDMETGIRERRLPQIDNPPLTRVSVAKCRAVMQAVAPWIERGVP